MAVNILPESGFIRLAKILKSKPRDNALRIDRAVLVDVLNEFMQAANHIDLLSKKLSEAMSKVNEVVPEVAVEEPKPE